MVKATKSSVKSDVRLMTVSDLQAELADIDTHMKDLDALQTSIIEHRQKYLVRQGVLRKTLRDLEK